MSSRKSSTSFLPDLTRKMSQILEKEPPPSPPSERVRAPPSTPERPKLEVGGSELAHIDSRTTANNTAAFPPSSEPCQHTLDSPPSSRSGRRKSRKKGTSSRDGPFLKRFKPALVLENSGSVARDHLASERTFLAYVRTSLMIATTGVGERRHKQVPNLLRSYLRNSTSAVVRHRLQFQHRE
jgi:hypothetical protein